jgi:hypothetical protein
MLPSAAFAVDVGLCKFNGAVGKDNKGSQVSYFSSNTNAGGGNGGELVIGPLCISEIDGQAAESLSLGNAQNPLFGFIASDPGNSGRGGNNLPN